jgi:hypothetical protein
MRGRGGARDRKREEETGERETEREARDTTTK